MKKTLPKKQTNIFLLVPFLTQVMCVHITTQQTTHTYYSLHLHTKANGSFKHTEKDKQGRADVVFEEEEENARLRNYFNLKCVRKYVYMCVCMCVLYVCLYYIDMYDI